MIEIFIRNKKVLLSLFSFLVIGAFSAPSVFAVWSGTFYSAGETLNPECSPTDIDCDVLPPMTLKETGAGTDTVTIQAPAAIGTSFTLTLPTDDGTASQYLQTDGSGNLTWATISAGLVTGTTAITSGTDTRVFFNDGGLLGEDAGFTYNKTTDSLTLGGSLTIAQGSSILNSGGSNSKLTLSDAAGTTLAYGVTNTLVIGSNSTVLTGPAGSLDINLTTSTLNSATVVGGTNVTGTEKSLVVNNNTSTGNIFEAQDNGTAVFTVADGGAVTLGGARTISGSNQFIDMSVANDVSIGSPAGYPYLTVKGGSGLVQVSSWGLGFTAVANSTGTPVTILKGNTTATLQMGADVNGAAVNQTFKAHDGITGTDISGANLTIAGGRGTGSGAGGTLIFQTAPALTSGTTAQTLATALTINKPNTTGDTWNQMALHGRVAMFETAHFGSSVGSRIELGETSANRPTIGPGSGTYMQILSGTTGTLFTQNDTGAFQGVWENDGDLVVGSAGTAGARLEVNGVTGTKKGAIINNGTSTGNIFEAQDNGTAVFTVADGGAVTATGLTTLDNVMLGSMDFEADSGIISWVDMSVSSTPADNTVQSYTAGLDGNSMITVYGQADGAGATDTLGVGIRTTAPTATLHVSGTTGTQKTFIANNNTSTGNIAEFQDGGTAVFTIADGGASSFGTTTTAGTATSTFRPTITGASATSNFLNITGTFPATLSAETTAVKIAVTGNSQDAEQYAMSVKISGVTTQNNGSIAGAFENSSTASGTTPYLVTGVIGNASGTTSSHSKGVWGLSGATSGNAIGVYGSLAGASGFPATSAAVAANNGTTANNIFVGLDGGTAVFTVADGGLTSITANNATGVTTASALALNANSLTTGTGFYGASSTLTSGKLMDLQISGTAAAASQTGLNILLAGATATNAITTYGAQISNTHTNATSGTNVALYLNASGATTANYALQANGAVSLTGGLTTIDDLSFGATSFEADAGMVSWMDMPVTSSAAINTVESYLAQLDGNAMISVYGISDGAGGVKTKNLGVGIGTATPLVRLDVAGSGRVTGTATSVLTGSINPTASTTVTGVGTLFTTELVVGDRITVSGETRTVTAIASATSLTVDTAFTDTADDASPDKLNAIFVGRDSSNAVQFLVNDLGNVSIGGVTPTRSTTVGTNQLTIIDGTAPAGTMTNGISLYSTAGELRVMDAAGNATLLSPHENEHNYWVFDSRNQATGKGLLIDMEEMMKRLNNTFGWDFVHEVQDGLNVDLSTDIVPLELPDTFMDAIFTKVTAWLGDASNGITNIFAGEVETQNLCVSDGAGAKTCITKAELDALILNAGITAPEPTPEPAPEPAPTETCSDGIQNQDETGVDTGGVCVPEEETPAPEEGGEEEVVPEPEPEVVPEPEPEPTPEPAPEPVPEVTP